MNTPEEDFLRLAWNAASAIASLKPGESISREDLIDALRRPLPDPDLRPSEAIIRQSYRYYVLRAALDGADMVVTYPEAARLTGKTETAIRQAAYRGHPLVRLSTRFMGRERKGVTLLSLAAWMRWPYHVFAAATMKVPGWRADD